MPERPGPQPESSSSNSAQYGWEGLTQPSDQQPLNQEAPMPSSDDVDPLDTNRALGRLHVTKQEEVAAAFLHKQNPQLNNSDGVKHTITFLREQGAKVPDKAASRIGAYLDLASDPDYINDGILTGDKVSIDRQIDSIVIQADDVPESYFDLQKRIAREQGHGDVQIHPEQRNRMIENLQKEQKRSLGRWARYLSSPTNEISYPLWFRQYAFEGVQKLGPLDKERGEFAKRGKDTTAPFADLSPEALGYVLDAIVKNQPNNPDGSNSEDDDAELSQLAKVGSFRKLYAHAILRTAASPEQLSTTEGSWRKFDQISGEYGFGSNTTHPTAQALSSSLQGHGTGWCTAGEETAQGQLSNGDFYVYYSKDEEEQDVVPRVAIRMQRGVVAEVRGILPSQSLEGEMVDIAMEKLQELPGGEAYNKKADDMRRLTNIDKAMASDPFVQLPEDDLRFLYEIDRKIEGFGQNWDGEVERDPRIDELLGKRDVFADMMGIYPVQADEVATNATLTGHTRVVVGDLDCRNIVERNPPPVVGDKRIVGSALAALQSRGFRGEGEDLDEYLEPIPAHVQTKPIRAVTGHVVGFDEARHTLTTGVLKNLLAIEGNGSMETSDLLQVAQAFDKDAQRELFNYGLGTSQTDEMLAVVGKFDLIDVSRLAERALAKAEQGTRSGNRGSIDSLVYSLGRFHGLSLEFAERYISTLQGRTLRLSNVPDGNAASQVLRLISSSNTFETNDIDKLNHLLVKISGKENPNKAYGRDLVPIIEKFSGLDAGILDGQKIMKTSHTLSHEFLMANADHFDSFDYYKLASRAIQDADRHEWMEQALIRSLPYVTQEEARKLLSQIPTAYTNGFPDFTRVDPIMQRRRNQLENMIGSIPE